MTEQTATPKVVALNPSQWKAVVLNDVALLHQALSNIAAPTDIDIANIDAFVANTRNMLYGWKVAGAQAQAAAQAVKSAGKAEPVAATNGAAPPAKRKGGWPAGKPRGSKANTVVAQ